jgi:hypothetical protein
MSGFPAPAARTENQDHRSYCHSPGPSQGSPLLGASQVSSSQSTISTASTATHPNPNDHIPRTAAGSIFTRINIPELFPHLQKEHIEKWVEICDAYSDRAYNGGYLDHLEPLSTDEIENSPRFKRIPGAYLPQHTPGVEHRQSHGLPEEIKNDNTEKDDKEQSNPE